MNWKELHVGAERGINCEHMLSLLTNIIFLQRHWEWQEDRRDDAWVLGSSSISLRL